MKPHFHSRAFSLVELLVTIMIIGTITAVSLPYVTNMFENSKKAKARANAKRMESMSAQLASLGVAHVIPDSMGGVEATARLFRQGVTVPEGPMAGEKFIMASLQDEDIDEMRDYLVIRYDARELRIEYQDPFPDEIGMNLYDEDSVHRTRWMVASIRVASFH